MVVSVRAVEWVLTAGGGLAVTCLTWIFGGAARASIRTTTATRRDTLLLDELFDGTQTTVTYRTGAGTTGGPTATVLIAGAIDRGYRFLEASRHGGRTTMEFRRSRRRTTDT